MHSIHAINRLLEIKVIRTYVTGTFFDLLLRLLRCYQSSVRYLPVTVTSISNKPSWRHRHVHKIKLTGMQCAVWRHTALVQPPCLCYGVIFVHYVNVSKLFNPLGFFKYLQVSRCDCTLKGPQASAGLRPQSLATYTLLSSLPITEFWNSLYVSLSLLQGGIYWLSDGGAHSVRLAFWRATWRWLDTRATLIGWSSTTLSQYISWHREIAESHWSISAFKLPREHPFGCNSASQFILALSRHHCPQITSNRVLYNSGTNRTRAKCTALLQSCIKTRGDPESTQSPGIRIRSWGKLERLE